MTFRIIPNRDKKIDKYLAVAHWQGIQGNLVVYCINKKKVLELIQLSL